MTYEEAYAWARRTSDAMLALTKVLQAANDLGATQIFPALQAEWQAACDEDAAAQQALDQALDDLVAASKAQRLATEP